MIIVFGKWKVWTWLSKLLNKLKLENLLMDDADYDIEKLELADKIVASPGIKQDHKIYQDYNEKVFSELNFLGDIIEENWLANNIEFAAVTGTNGKSSSVHIMYNLFKWLFKKLKINTRVYLSGNFGTPLSDTLCEIIDINNQSNNANKNIENKHLVILECSSFMLYKLSNFAFDYSILTNLWVDHLDWHKDLEEYFDSKFNIIKYTKTYVTTNQDCIGKYKNRLSKTDTKVFEDTRIEPYKIEFDLSKTQFLWEYNKWNWNAIYKLIWEYFDNNEMKLNDKDFWSIAKTVEPLEHRMKLIKNINTDWSKNNIKIYDDGICTSSAALNAALSCFDQKIVLIAGGFDKWEDYNWLWVELENRIWFACLIWQTAKKFSKIFDEKNIEYKIFDDLNSAILYSVDMATKLKLDNILFSPGSASFDMFDNVYARCDQFCSIIDNL